MKSRFIAMLVALPALVAGLLVFSPAEAVTHNTYVSTKYVTMSSISATGLGGKVSVSCHGSKRCKGTLYFEGSEGRKRSYSLKGNSKATISVTMSKGSAADPFANGTNRGRGNVYKAVSNVRLFVNEDSPRNVTVNYRVQTETRSDGRIYYDLDGNFAGLTDVKVELHRVLRGGNTDLVATRSVTSNGDSGYFKSKLGANNTPGSSFKMKLRARDTASNRPIEWWWRGTSNNTAGGSRYLREGNTVRSTKDGFTAPIFWGTISGAAPANADVRVYAPPASFSGGTAVRRELDVPSCANIFGEDEATGGAYSVPFLPYDNAGPKNYMVMTKVGGEQVWLGNGGQRFGSCHAVLAYKFSRTNLIALNGPTLGGQNVTAAAPRKTTHDQGEVQRLQPDGLRRVRPHPREGPGPVGPRHPGRRPGRHRQRPPEGVQPALRPVHRRGRPSHRVLELVSQRLHQQQGLLQRRRPRRGGLEVVPQAPGPARLQDQRS